jgi:hypothetical protein
MSDPTAFGYGSFRFSWGDHICAIFDDHAQQMEVMVPFFAHGLHAGQRCVWVGPELSCTALRKGLAAVGADLPTLEASGQLIILRDVDYYLKDGLFEPVRTMELLQTLARDGKEQGYETMRVTGDVSWLVQERVDAEIWALWEAALNEAVAGQPMVVVCQYDRRQISGDMVVTALQTHPFVILGGAVHANPFYEPAPGALAELM